MTTNERDFIQSKIAEVIELANVNKSLEYMVFVYDNYLTDKEKMIIDIDGIVLHATKNSELIINKLDEVNSYIFKTTQDQKGD